MSKKTRIRISKLPAKTDTLRCNWTCIKKGTQKYIFGTFKGGFNIQSAILLKIEVRH